MDQDLKNNILSTGTSLVGIVCKDGIVMAGDRKATVGGRIIMQKNAVKVEAVNDYLVISGTGTSSDIELAKKLIKAQLKLKELKDKKRPTIKESANMIAMMAYKNIRQPSMIPFMAGLMVGGLNEDGKSELYSVEPAGSVMVVEDFDANFSSGMPYILGLLERQWKKNLTIEEGVELAIDAIKAASQRDTASGLGVDVFTITKEGIKHVSKQTAAAVYTESE
ncbi:proteasome subunit beta [archaeon]|jgi:proteasome beta subunit|nr:proteasome subunit beta [archaeon]MBT6182433.1 proteasome subunit beta [archaeon]MBT6606334.1 proteasome subunit beta [archaeon]MBT7251497.1 proteasome subunit beta [archaeon]MBT7660762.1 proteasome subunit beta [archaeon]